MDSKDLGAVINNGLVNSSLVEHAVQKDSTLQSANHMKKLHFKTNFSLTINEETNRIFKEMDSISVNERKFTMFNRHHNLKPSDRAVLLDWLLKLSADLEMTRQTYYQCVDYLDRFFSLSRDICKDQLQLIGITCLYLSNKQEGKKYIKLSDILSIADEIEPIDVLIMERHILKTLGSHRSVWNLNKWVFMLLRLSKRDISTEEFFKLIDILYLATLDVKSLKYSYSILASSCIYLITSVSIIFPFTSTYGNSQMSKCITWLRTYWNNVKKKHSTRDVNVLTLSSLDDSAKLLSGSKWQHYTNNYQTTQLKILKSIFHC